MECFAKCALMAAPWKATLHACSAARACGAAAVPRRAEPRWLQSHHVLSHHVASDLVELVCSRNSYEACAS
jgi:hypothetical protein